MTGGIGAGKSTVWYPEGNGCRSYRCGPNIKKGDTTRRAGLEGNHRLFRTGKFSCPIKTLTGKLARLVFNSEEKRRKLEKIIHARVIDEIKDRINTLRAEGYDGMVVLDVPIPVRNGFLDIVDTVWVVVCPDEERIRRVMARSGMDRADAESRIRSQLPQEDYIRLADVVIENHGDLETLRHKVAGLLAGS